MKRATSATAPGHPRAAQGHPGLVRGHRGSFRSLLGSFRDIPDSSRDIRDQPTNTLSEVRTSPDRRGASVTLPKRPRIRPGTSGAHPRTSRNGAGTSGCDSRTSRISPGTSGYAPRTSPRRPRTPETAPGASDRLPRKRETALLVPLRRFHGQIDRPCWSDLGEPAPHFPADPLIGLLSPRSGQVRLPGFRSALSLHDPPGFSA